MHSAFLKIVAVMLIVTGIGKLWGLFISRPPVILQEDPLLGIKFGILLLLASTFEFLVATICLLRPRAGALGAVLWLALVLLLYRIGLFVSGWHKPCGCLGGFEDVVNIAPGLANGITFGMLGFMLFGSVALITFQKRQAAAALFSPQNAHAAKAT